jgi:hypothetical protein
MRTAFEHEGDIRGVDLLACLVALWREGASGSLQFSRSGATAGFEIAAGELVASSSSDPRFETAAILARAGKLDTRTLERLAAPEGADRALLALQAGVLTRREWRWGEKIRAVEILSDLLTWLEGEYWFFRTTEAEREKAEPRLPIPRLVLELFLRSRDRGLVLKYLGGADVPLARAANFDTEFGTFGLTADAESVVRLIDGTATAEEIASEAPAEAFAVEKLLAALVTLGLVHPEFAPGGAAAEPGERLPAEAPAPVAREEEGEEEEKEEGREAAQEEEVSAEEEPTAPGEEGLAEEDLELEEPGEEFPQAEEEGGPRELGEDFGEEVLPEEEPMTDAALAGGPALEPDLESAAFGRETAPAHLGSFEGREAQTETGFDRPLDASTGVGLLERPRHRSGSLLLWTLAALAVAVGGVLWMRSRATSSAPGPGATAALTPTEVPVAVAAPLVETSAAPTAAAAGPAPASAPTAAPAAVATERPTRARPTARPTAARPTPAPAPAAAQVAGGQSSRQHWLDRAARDASRLAGDRKTHYAIQLELVCEVGSLVEAFQHDRPAGSMWVLSTPFEGKTCFRILWGRYATVEAARRALPRAPRFFSTPKNHPAVTGVR